MLVQMHCPQCGATLDFDQSKDFMFCTFCGYKIANVAQKVEIQQNINQNINVSGTVVQKTDKSGEPNLYINYGTNDMGVGMITRIVDTNQKNVYLNGQTMTYHLPKGLHAIAFKIGKRNYSRNIYIREDNEPVRITAGYNGRAFINIDQPEYTLDSSDTAAVRAVPATATVSPKKSPFSILSFVFSLTMIGAPIGLGFGIYDLFFNKNKEQSHGLAIAGLVIGFFMTIALIASIFAS